MMEIKFALFSPDLGRIHDFQDFQQNPQKNPAKKLLSWLPWPRLRRGVGVGQRVKQQQTIWLADAVEWVDAVLWLANESGFFAGQKNVES